MFRGVILTATTNPGVSRFVRSYGMRMGAARFVAGETLDEAVLSLRKLNEQGLVTNTTLLGEGVRDESTAMVVVDEYEKILDRIAAEKLQTNIALKLTHLGLDVSEELAFRSLTRLVEHAQGLGNFIRIDMEESARVDTTLRIYRRMLAEGHENVGTVLQAYLYRTERDLDELLPLKPNLRLVKGAYLEPQNIAYPQKADVDRNYLRLAERMLSSDGYTAIATHDEQIIDYVVNYTHSLGIERDRFEFQMLYGIRPQLQLELVQQGYKVLVATPFGREWYFYLMRRLAERPANAFFLIRNLILK
jgi:proline dehydrogenase